ncbi:hypothetical protein MVEN_02312700 [Mycena venus]|uniref:Fungal N-terminal domain-containing protein n=1 Tax=Mycena venus TaxID=2733690 RepID=A0A8H6X4L2_9AGAR|nr:hypothetical protein MVEN_02312700 [Mycena venus]
MPLVVAAALTFGSFGDILDAVKIAKRTIDMLRKGVESHERHRLISTLNGLCEDMATLTVIEEGRFTIRLRAEIDLCRLLMEQFYAKIKSYEGPLRWIWGIASEEKELTAWRAQISERRAALYHVLGSLITMQLHDVGERLGGLGSQVQYIGSRVDIVQGQLQNVGNIGTLGFLISTFLSAEVSSIRSEIRQIGSDVRQIPKLSPHDISDPVFFVMDPLGKPITIQLSRCDSFNALDRILKAYLYGRAAAGSRYVERGIQFDMSIIKRTSFWHSTVQNCPHCGNTNTDAVEGSWINCTNLTCGARYQVAKSEASVPAIEGVSSPKIIDRAELVWQEDEAESFRLVQIFYSIFQQNHDGYDYSPEAYNRHLKTLERIKLWMEVTGR